MGWRWSCKACSPPAEPGQCVGDPRELLQQLEPRVDLLVDLGRERDDEDDVPHGAMAVDRLSEDEKERIKELQPLFHGEYVVILRHGTKLTLSRNYREALHQLMGKAP